MLLTLIRNLDGPLSKSLAVEDGRLVMKFPRFRGHRNICVSGVRNVEETSPIPA